jgi:predicted peroxiredoxin
MSKVLLISTHFDDNLEIATMPWAVGNAALAEDKEVTIYLQGLAVREAQRGGTKGLRFPPFPWLETLQKAFVENGGDVDVCAPCMNAHSVERDELIEGAEPGGCCFPGRTRPRGRCLQLLKVKAAGRRFATFAPRAALWTRQRSASPHHTSCRVDGRGAASEFGAERSLEQTLISTEPVHGKAQDVG